MNTLEVGQGRARVVLSWNLRGNDLHVHIGGGSQHIGACALAGPCDGCETQADVLHIPPHREGDLALNAAKTLQRVLNTTVCVTAGIHLDAITKAEIELVLRNAEEGISRLARRLQAESSEKP